MDCRRSSGQLILRMKLMITLGLLLCSSFMHGQKYYSKTGKVQFLSKAPLENIEASNENGYVVYDATGGQIEWSVLIKGFKFQKALMQQHFNENYMESDKYPKAIFKGKVDNPSSLNLSKDGEYNVSVKGELTIHGLTKPLSTRGVIRVKGGQVSASSSFDIAIADYNIEVPKVVRENIAKVVRVTVHSELALLQ